MRIDRLLFLVLSVALLVGAVGRASAQPACPHTNKQRYQYTVKIDSAPPGATIHLDNIGCAPIGKTPWTGKINSGSVTIVLEAPGYETATVTWKVARTRRAQSKFVPMTRRPQIEVRADADRNLVGATVSVDGVPQGDVQGPLVIQTTAGRHLVEIKKAGFETFSSWVDLTSTPSIVLTPALKEVKKYGTVIVESDVPDAEVYIDQNKHPDNTTATITNVPAGVHVIEVRKDGQTWTKTINVKPDEQVKIRAELNAGVGAVRVISDTPGARVFIDGIDKGPVPAEIKDIKAGEHVIQIKAEGFKTFEQTVNVTPNSNELITKQLEADIPADTGTLKIITNEPEAQVFIDGVAVGTAQELRKPAGEYLVMVKLPGHKDFTQKVKVEPGQQAVVTADLKAVGKLRILSNPAGATVMINGFVAGKTPFETEVETGDTILRLELPGFNAYEETIRVDGGDKTQTISRELAVAGKSEDELRLERRGLSAFGARTLPRGRSTVDIDAGYPYFANARISVGAGRIAERFGFDASVAVRTFLARSELGLGARAMLSNAQPFSAGVFSNLWWGSKLFDDSFRNGVTWEAGGLLSLTALSNVTITGRGYFQIWSDRHCPPLDDTMSNGFEGTDPIDTCVGYKARVIDGQDPMNFSAEDAARAEKLTGNTGREFFDRDNGVRFLLSVIAEIAVDDRWNVYGIFEGAPFQGRDERALFTDLFSGTMGNKDFLFYGRFGLTYKF